MFVWGYILRSQKTGAYYVGQTRDLEGGNNRHNAGYEKYTRAGRPWVLVFSRMFGSRSEAVKWERQAKGRKSRASLERLMQRAGDSGND